MNVVDSENFVSVLLEYAPIDHLVYSAVDSPARKPIEELDIKMVKESFDIKFWGAVTSAKG